MIGVVVVVMAVAAEFRRALDNWTVDTYMQIRLQGANAGPCLKGGDRGVVDEWKARMAAAGMVQWDEIVESLRMSLTEEGVDDCAPEEGAACRRP